MLFYLFSTIRSNSVMEKSKLILLMCFLVCLSCTHANDLQPPIDEDDKTEQITENTATEVTWYVRLKLKPQADASYPAVEDPEIKALLLKYKLLMPFGQVKNNY
jgi:hypothetical protein